MTESEKLLVGALVVVGAGSVIWLVRRSIRNAEPSPQLVGPTGNAPPGGRPPGLTNPFFPSTLTPFALQPRL